MPIACNMTTWPRHVEKIFTLYRVLIFFWMIFGISFSMTIVTLGTSLKKFLTRKILVNRRVEKYLQKKFPNAFIVEEKKDSVLKLFMEKSVPKSWDPTTGTHQKIKEEKLEVVLNTLEMS
jgi:hypothetical protein